MALELAIPNQIQSDHIEAQRTLDEYASENTPSGWSSMNQKFQFTLYEPCGNVQLLAMISDIQRRIGPVARKLVTETSGLDRLGAEHGAILQACKNGAVDEGVDLLRKHVQTTKKEIVARLRRGFA